MDVLIKITVSQEEAERLIRSIVSCVAYRPFIRKVDYKRCYFEMGIGRRVRFFVIPEYKYLSWRQGRDYLYNGKVYHSDMLKKMEKEIRKKI